MPASINTFCMRSSYTVVKIDISEEVLIQCVLFI